MADMKTMDGGFLETSIALSAGADITSVCGAASDSTISFSLQAAKKYNKKVIVDMIGVKDQIKRAKSVFSLGVHYVCFHIGLDEQAKGISVLNKIKKHKLKHTAIAGGGSLENIEKVLKLRPEIVIVGSAITNAKVPERLLKN